MHYTLNITKNQLFITKNQTSDFIERPIRDLIADLTSPFSYNKYDYLNQKGEDSNG